MLFNTFTFAVFMVVFYTLYRVCTLRAQNILLLVGSYIFYGWWDWRFCSLLAISTVVDFSVARMLDGAEDTKKRRALLLVSVCTNLGILGFFKYFNFFIGSAAEVLEAVGLSSNMPVLRVVLPVGISFYTFQTMAYTIDVFRRRCEPTRDPIAFGVYVAYFPQLVAGPIERAQNLIPQITKERRIDLEHLYSGALLVLIGLVRKVAIADAVAPEVNRIFANPADLSSETVLRGVLLFGLQIYGDFAGYTDIARGISRMMGIELMENFNHPYFSTNITEFWRRWHISLSSWLRDYLYIPLGGNRGPSWFVYRNLLLTMLLGGLWHGAAWTFVVWGAIHGVALAVHKLFLRGGKPPERVQPANASQWARAVLAWIATMIVVYVAWVFFRAESFANAFDVLASIARMEGGFNAGAWSQVAIAVAILLLIDVPQYFTRNHTIKLLWPWPMRGAVYALFVLILLAYSGRNEDVPFIYFQF